MLEASASSVTGRPVKDSNSSRNSPIISAILPGAQVSLIELMSIPKNTGMSGSTARTTSAAPMSWMQWSARNNAS